MKIYLFSYPYKGARYSFEIPADNAIEAQERARAIGMAKYDGELAVKVPVGVLGRVWVFLFGSGDKA